MNIFKRELEKVRGANRGLPSGNEVVEADNTSEGVRSQGGVPDEVSDNLVPRDEDAVILSLDQVSEDPKQARKSFYHIDDLAQNIAQYGQQQAVVVKRVGQGRYQIIEGARRYRALCSLAKLHPGRFDAIRAWVNEDERLEDPVAMKLVQLSANLQRDDVPPLELAREYQHIMREKNWKQKELAQAIGKSPASVSKVLKLLKLSEEDQVRLAQGQLSVTAVKENGGYQGDRQGRLSMPESVARDMAMLLSLLAERHQLASIHLPETPSRADVMRVLENRSAEVLAVVRGERG